MNMLKVFFKNTADPGSLAETVEQGFATTRKEDPPYPGDGLVQRIYDRMAGNIYSHWRQASADDISKVTKNQADYLTLTGTGQSEAAPKEMLAVKKSDVLSITHNAWDNSATVFFRKGFLGMGAGVADVRGIAPEELTTQVAAAKLTHKLRAPEV